MFLMFFHHKMLLKIDTMHLNAKINSYMKPWKRKKCLIHQRPESPFADVDECTSGLHSCHKFASCTNTIGSYSCSCQQHFNGDGKTASTLRAVSIVLGVKLIGREQNSRWSLTRAKTSNRLSFSGLFDDILLVFNVRRLCVVVDSLISAAKVYNCVISKWFW